MKEHDLMLSLLSSGPDVSLADFLAAGYTPDNTGLETDEKEYKLYKVVRENFTREDGTFDDEAFHQYYLKVETMYNALSHKQTIEDLYKQTSWKANNVFAPEGVERRQGPDIIFSKMLNPSRDSWGTTTLGKFKEGTESIDEIAQSNKVLANPVDVENGAAPIWHESPNDSFWTDFFDTRVLALWDYDADKDGKRTTDPDEVVYHKGQLKLNDKGEYYYENLLGRDIYGRKVLAKLNTLTVDGSEINKYDFFDSDDKQEKSVTGTLMKNLALVGTMFIPYVGPVIAGLSMGTQVVGMAAKLGKMVSGSDNPTLSAIEGWTESWNRQQLKSEYAQNNTWCWENMIDVVGDLVGQLREQRIIFQYVPALFKGAKAIEWNGFTKNAEKKFLAELSEDWSKKYWHKSISSIMKTKEGQYLALDMKDLAGAGAQIAYRLYMKDYYKIGEALSKMYMAGLISSNMYSEAKANGVSDDAAAWTTFGRFCAEMGLLYTPVGNAILPELRAGRLAERAMFESSINKAATFAKVNQVAASEVNKMNKFKEFFRLGTKLADKSAERVYANNAIDTFKSSLASGAEIGIVNDIEEFLNDMFKTIYNSARDEDSPKLEAWTNMFDRYGMGMVSGLVGGTITSAFTNYGQIVQARATTPEQALQQMIYFERNGELDKILKNLDKYSLGDKNLSATEYDIITDKDGNEQIIWKAGTKDNNQDIAAKNAIRLQAKLVKEILSSNGINLTDESFLKTQSPEFAKEIKFGMLMKSFAAGRLLQKFNTACSDIVRLTNEINNAQPKTDAGKAAAEKSDGETVEEQTIAEKKKALKEAVKIKDDILKGKYSQEFVRDVVYELSPLINHAFIKPSFVRYVEYVKKKPINKISENELNDLKTKWEAWRDTDMKDYLHICAGIHQEIVEKSADVVRKAEQILNDTNDPILKTIRDFLEVGFSGMLEVNLLDLQRAGVEITPEIYSEIVGQTMQQMFNNFGATLYLKLYSEEQYKQLTDLMLEYNRTRNDNTKIKEHEDLAKQINLIIKDAFNNNIGKIVNPIIERGYINSEVRFLVLDMLYKQLNEITNELQKWENFDENMLSPVDKAKRDELTGYKNEMLQAVEKIKELPHTPIEEIINQFSITAKGEPLNVSELLDKLNGILKGSIQDPSALLLGNDINEQVRQAILLLDVFEAVIEGAKTDNGQMNNLLGYNYYLNKLMPETNAPEITSEAGNVLILDINTIRNKLEFFYKLNAQNLALKIGTNHRVQLNFNYLAFDKLRSIKIPESWKGKEEWKSTIADAENLQNNIDKKSLGINPKVREAINLEMMHIQDALHKLINDNLEHLDELFSIQNFNYFDTTSNIFNEASEALNDASLLGWMVDAGALKFSSFKRMLIESRDGKIAPISSLELAAYKQLGRIVNGKFYKAAYDAIRKNIVEYWKNLSKDLRIEFAKKLYSNLDLNLLEKFAEQEDILNIVGSLRWVNEIFTEGIPGSGKTNAVLPITLKILQNNYKELLKRVAYIHGGSKSSAELGILKLKNIGIDTSGFVAYDKAGFLQNISEWTPYETKSVNGHSIDIIPESRLKIDKDTGEIRSSDKLKYTENPFTLVIFDEATNANTFEHDVIDAYGNQYGTVTLSFGDLDQDGSYGQATIQGKLFNVGINPTNFFPGMKLGVSMRVNNSQKAQDLRIALQWVNSNDGSKLELHYYEDETGLYGEKVINVDPNELNISERIENEILKLAATLKDGEKIGFITDDITSLSSSELSKDKYKDIVEIFDTNVRSPQGLESQYYIIDLTSDEATKDFKRHIYTGISRSIQGTLILDNAIDEDGRKIQLFNNILDEETISQEIPIEKIKELSEKDSEFWREHVKDAEIPKILNAEKLPDLPKPDAPVIDEGNGEYPVDVIPTTQSKEKTQLDAREKSKVEEPKYDVVKEEGKDSYKIDVCYYTFNKFETGIEKGPNGEAVQWGKDVIRHLKRIDSANGLMNLDRMAGRPFRTFDEYRVILDQLHSAILNAKDVLDLHDKINKVLSANGFGNLNISTKFGFKSSARPPKDGSREFSSLDGSKFVRFDKYYKDKNNYESVEYIHANDTRSFEANQKSIVLMIGNQTYGDFLEIPCIQLPHVGTVIDKLPGDETGEHGQIKLLWDSVKQHDDAVKKLLDGMKSTGLDKIYPDLVKIGEVFRVTSNAFVDLGNWNPYTNLLDLGILGVYSDVGTEYGRPGFHYDVPYIPISLLAENSEIVVTPVLYSKTNSIDDGTNVYENVIEAGLPFVLVSYDSSIPDLVRAWLDGSNKVQKVYVVPPRATVEQYFDNLINIFDKNLQSIEDIGNDVTAYTLTKTLLLDLNFRDNVQYNLKEREFVKLDLLIKDLDSLDKKTLVRKLQTNPEGQNKTYKELFRLFLKELVKPTGQVIVNYKGFNSAPNRQLIVETLNKAGIDGVYYQVRPPKSGQEEFGRFFYKAGLNNNWTITTSTGQQLSYTIHGKIDSNVYKADTSIFKIILDGLSINSKSGMWEGNANDAYIKGQYSTSGENSVPTNFNVGDKVMWNGSQYTITNIINGNYELSGKFGHLSMTISINSGNTSFTDVSPTDSMYKISDTVISPENIPYLVVDVDATNYLLRDVNTSQERIESKDVVESWNNPEDSIPTTKFKVGDTVEIYTSEGVRQGKFYTVVKISKGAHDKWLYKLKKSDSDTLVSINVEDADSNPVKYRTFEKKSYLEGENLIVELAPELSLTSKLTNDVLNNLALASYKSLILDTRGKVIVEFDNGTKIEIIYDPDASEHEATAYFSQEKLRTWIDEKINNIKVKYPDLAYGFEGMTAENSSIYRDIVDNIEIYNNELISEGKAKIIEDEDLQILKDITQKDIDSCNGIPLIFK